MSIYDPFNYPIISTINDFLGNNFSVVYPIKSALGFLVPCFVVVISPGD